MAKSNKGITNIYRAQFFGGLNEKLLSKIQEQRNDSTRPTNYRTSEQLEKDFAIKCEKYGLDKSEVVNISKARFTYENTLTARGAVMIIAKKKSPVAAAAKLSLEDEEQFPDFINYIKDQVKDGNLEALNRNHGPDVIEAILNFK